MSTTEEVKTPSEFEHKVNIDFMTMENNNKMWAFSMAIQRACHAAKQNEGLPDMAQLVRDADTLHKWFLEDEVPEQNNNVLSLTHTSKVVGQS